LRWFSSFSRAEWQLLGLSAMSALGQKQPLSN
jgi:hypothetical protein